MTALLQTCLSGLVDIAVHFEDWAWPSSWTTKKVGALTWGLVVRAKHPIKSRVELQHIQNYPFVTASYLMGDRLERIPDAFPLRLSQRWLGHESQTAFATKNILLSSDHVAFLPLISMEKEIFSGELRVINVLDMKLHELPLRLSFHQDRVLKKSENSVTDAVEKMLAVNSELSRSLRHSDSLPLAGKVSNGTVAQAMRSV